MELVMDYQNTIRINLKKTYKKNIKNQVHDNKSLNISENLQFKFILMNIYNKDQPKVITICLQNYYESLGVSQSLKIFQLLMNKINLNLLGQLNLTKNQLKFFVS